VKLQGELSGEFMINRGLWQGDVSSADLFNLILEKVMRQMKIQKG
jgi:hypothetical protein